MYLPHKDTSYRGGLDIVEVHESSTETISGGQSVPWPWGQLQDIIIDREERQNDLTTLFS